jgi:hypothetical protein
MQLDKPETTQFPAKKKFTTNLHYSGLIQYKGTTVNISFVNPIEKSAKLAL